MTVGVVDERGVVARPVVTLAWPAIVRRACCQCCVNLLGRHVEVDDAAPVMRQREKHEKHVEGHRWHDKEVDSYELSSVLIEKCPP